MSTQSPRHVRPPVVAGMFYPDDPEECRNEAQAMLAVDEPVAASTRWFGAVVPHAGWICSGKIAGRAIRALQAQVPDPDVVVVFGAVHTAGGIDYAALDDHAQWSLPSGCSNVAMDLQCEVVAASKRIMVDPRVHRKEHAVEVELPLIQQAWPDAAILPIEVPPVEYAPEIGAQTARALKAAGRSAVFLASSDLTHYGPNYDFAPAGPGLKGIRWAMGNDQRLLDLITDMQADMIVAETQANLNACGGGAIAALLGACNEWGATRANILEHTNSYAVLSKALGRESSDNSVGYAAVVIG
jgi:MEMO1 family protein